MRAKIKQFVFFLFRWVISLFQRPLSGIKCEQCGKLDAVIRVAFAGTMFDHSLCDKCKKETFEWHRRNGKEPQIILEDLSNN